MAARLTDKAKILQHLYELALQGLPADVAEPEGPFFNEQEQHWYDLLRHAKAGGGAGASSADRLAVTNAGYQNQQQINDVLLYVPLCVAGFGPTVGVQLLGTTLVSVTLNWGYNKTVTSQTVAGAARAVALRTLTLPANLTATTGYGLSASDGRNTVNAGTAVYFSNDRFWFVGAPGLDVPPAGAGTDRPAGETRGIQFTLTAGAGQKIYYMRPARLGAGTYVVGGFAGGFVERTVAYVNVAGYTENYIIAESANVALGLTTVNVS